MKKSQEPRIPTLEAKSKNDDFLVVDNNIKIYTLGAKVSKKMNIDCD